MYLQPLIITNGINKYATPCKQETIQKTKCRSCTGKEMVAILHRKEIGEKEVGKH